MYGKYDNTSSSPARKCFVITPSDSSEIEIKALRAPSDGVITIRAIDSTADVQHPVLEGEVINVRAKLVKATGTTVTGTIIGYA